MCECEDDHVDRTELVAKIPEDQIYWHATALRVLADQILAIKRMDFRPERGRKRNHIDDKIESLEMSIDLLLENRQMLAVTFKSANIKGPYYE